MNVANLLRRKLGLITVQNLQRVVNALVGYVGEMTDSTISYKVYTALITQSSTSAPTATILENTLGFTPVHSRIDVGAYGVTLGSSISRDKIFATVIYSTFDSEVRRMSVLEPGLANVSSLVYTLKEETAGEFVSVDGFSRAKIEIRIYP
jgi:hypothetical protein